MNDDLFGDRLLVIDDEHALGCLVKQVAQDAGFDAVVTDDPQVFVDTARRWRPSVILLDLRLPGTDGIQLLRSLAAEQCAAPIAVMSGADGKTLESAIELGHERGLNMAGVLPKPLCIAALRQLLAGFKRLAKPALSSDLERAIAGDRLFLEYQPTLDCRAGRITGAEALVRWRHPTLGVIPPDRFIALAEEIGLVGRLTDWVVAAAARQAAIWREEGLAIAVAVNISARDVEDFELPDRSNGCAAAAGSTPLR